MEMTLLMKKTNKLFLLLYSAILPIIIATTICILFCCCFIKKQLYLKLSGAYFAWALGIIGLVTLFFMIYLCVRALFARPYIKHIVNGLSEDDFTFECTTYTKYVNSTMPFSPISKVIRQNGNTEVYGNLPNSYSIEYHLLTLDLSVENIPYCIAEEIWNDYKKKTHDKKIEIEIKRLTIKFSADNDILNRYLDKYEGWYIERATIDTLCFALDFSSADKLKYIDAIKEDYLCRINRLF